MTATRAWILGLVLVTAGLAGCIGGDDGDPVEPTADDDSTEEQTNETEDQDDEEVGPAITSTWKNATWQGASAPNVGYYCFPPIAIGGGCDNALSFTVPGQATGVVAELAWEGDADVYYEVADANGTVLASETGASPLTLQVSEDLPEEGADWTATAWVDAATPTEVQATFVVSVVEDGEIPQFSKAGQSA